MADHIYSREARLDLLEIWEYIDRDNIGAAECPFDTMEKSTVEGG